jgi:hypothetical protein
MKNNSNVMIPGRTVVGLRRLIDDEEILLEVEKALLSSVNDQIKEQNDKRLSLNAIVTGCDWLGIMSFQLLNTREVPDGTPINVIENL